MTDGNELSGWFGRFRSTRRFARLRKHPVAYFCAEYALDPRLPFYAGGLGVLAGNMVREAADRELPLVAVGLRYRLGYYLGESPASASVGLEAVLDAKGDRLLVGVPIERRIVSVQAWRWRRGTVEVLLLDTDLEANAPTDRHIVDRLYVDDRQVRLEQEVILGVGGLRMLEALGVSPSVYHLNEGHSAILTLELTHRLMCERGLSFDLARQSARSLTVLTNHTLVPTGNETFSNDLVSAILVRYAEELGVPVSELIKLGLVQESSIFSMTMLALRMSSHVNAVSRLHAEKAKEIWTSHPMETITNGIHLPTWNLVGDDVSGAGDLWRAHQERKGLLLERVRKETGRDWGRDDLLVGWARRIVSYKCPLAVFDDLHRLAGLARDSRRPVRLVFSGQAHPGDGEGQNLKAKLMEIIDGELSDVAVFLPDYGLLTAPTIVAGCDVWLNTPIVGFEACGTSGMKAALNGVLPCSTRDGWMAEATDIGWMLDNENVGSNFLDVLERDIIPLYYCRDENGVPVKWEGNMRHARRTIVDRFGAGRMLKDYIEMFYLRSRGLE